MNKIKSVYGGVFFAWIRVKKRVYGFIFQMKSSVELIYQVPDGCSMKVGGTKVTWEEGELLIFDDSFEHEVWNNGTEERVIFILDIFHPDLSESQKKQDLFEIIL